MKFKNIKKENYKLLEKFDKRAINFCYYEDSKYVDKVHAREEIKIKINFSVGFKFKGIENILLKKYGAMICIFNKELIELSKKRAIKNIKKTWNKINKEKIYKFDIYPHHLNECFENYDIDTEIKIATIDIPIEKVYLVKYL